MPDQLHKPDAADLRGRGATSPWKIPWRGWRDACLRVKNQIGKDNISLISAGVSFYAFMALFPAITALLSIYGLIVAPAQMAQQLDTLRGTIPSSTMQMIQKQMTHIAASHSALGIGLIISVVLALYYASQGVGALIASLNIAYNEKEKRGFIKLYLVTFAATLAAVVFVVLMLVVIGLPGYLQHAGLPAWLTVLVRVGRWILTLGLMGATFVAIYVFAPSRDRPQIQWVSPGAIFATVVGVCASIAFSYYIAHFGSYNKMYGSVAAIVILMLWFWISTFVALIGAELNSELERQTRRGSTPGEPEAHGQRDAMAVDTVKKSH